MMALGRGVNMDQSIVDDFESRLPRDGDCLLKESTWAFDAQVVSDPAERFYRMPMGYKRAGDLLIDQAMTNVVDRSNVIYPALFCYRQSIELSLKRMVAEFGFGRVYTPRNTHNLIVLWDRFMDVVRDCGMGGSFGLPAAKELVIEMHAADEGSDGFRFPTDRNGAPFCLGDGGIDLDNLREVMDALVNLLECAYMAILHHNQAKW
jgi:hypothetical protein